MAPYHADFWLVAGSTAPALLIAAIVPGYAAVARTFEHRPHLLFRGWVLPAWGNAVVYVAAGLAIWLQANVISASLNSLTVGHDVEGTRTAMLRVFWGFALVAVAFGGSAAAELLKRRAKHQSKPTTAVRSGDAKTERSET